MTQKITIAIDGFSSTGKSTIASNTENNLFKEGYFTKVLDGDNIRAGLNNNLGFSSKDRKENIRRVAEVAKLFADTGIITICAFISPTDEIRETCKKILIKDYHLVHINCSVEECIKRDTKGLYKKALNGEIDNFTGISAPYEIPKNPQLIIDTQNDSINDCTQKLINYIKELQK